MVPMGHTGTGKMAIRHHVTLAAVVLSIFVWMFLPVRSAGFVYQDHNWVGANEIPEAQFPTPTSLSGVGRSLVRASWWLLARYSPEPLAGHLIDLSLHVTASALMALLVFNLGAPALAVWAAGSVFLLNPTQAEPATYLSARTDLIAVVGTLVVCIAMLRLSAGRLLVATLATLFAISGKETAVVIPVIVLAIRGRWISALVVLAVLVGVMYRYSFLWLEEPYAQWPLNQSVAMVRVLWSTVTTADHVVEYDYWGVHVATKWLCVTGLSAGFVWGLMVRHTRPLVAAGTVVIASVLVPRLIIPTPGSDFNAHKFYMGMIGASLIVAAFLTPKLEAEYDT